jgi:hypothetical protein
MVLLLPILWQWFRVREFRTFIGGTRIGDVALASDLRTRAVVWVWITYYLLMLGLVVLIFGLVLATAYSGSDTLNSEAVLAFFGHGGGAIAMSGGGFLIVVLGAILTEIMLRRRLWALRARSITAFNLTSLEQVIQTADEESLGVGEAFDTGFDIAG